jgi:hypothetical protein
LKRSIWSLAEMVVEKERVVTRVILGVVLEPVNKDDEQLGPGAASPGDAGTGWG